MFYQIFTYLKKHKVHKSSVLQHSFSYILFKTKKNKKREKNKKKCSNWKESQSLESNDIYLTTYFQSNEFTRIDERTAKPRIAMITQTQRRLKNHFSNNCRKVLSKVMKLLWLPSSGIGLKISRQILNHWEAKQNQWDFVCAIFLTAWANWLVETNWSIGSNQLF